jgi:hypothetical protein
MKREFREFCSKLPFKLIKTNVPGALSLPPIAKDSRTASPFEVLKAEFLKARPKAERSAIAEVWERASRLWSASDHIVPRMKTMRRNRRPVMGPARGGDRSANWSGGVVPGQWVTVYGSWKIPTVSKGLPAPGGIGTTDYMSGSWVGIDGWNGNEFVLQTGVTQNYSGGGQYGGGQYSAFWEWYPGNPTQVTNFSVAPGDTVSAMVAYDGEHSMAGFIQLVNETNGQHFQLLLTPPDGVPLVGSSVEWIMECPTGITAQLGPVRKRRSTHIRSDQRTESGGTGGGSAESNGIPAFTPIQFIDCKGGGPSGAANPSNGQIVNLITSWTAPTVNIIVTSVDLGPGAVTITYIG